MGGRSKFFLLAFLLAPLWLFAQEGKEGRNYYFNSTEEGVVFYQTLEWDPVPDIRGFEVVVEKQEPGGWVELMREFMEESSLTVSYGAGNYRFKVGIINLLGQKDYETPYQKFSVRFASQPKVEKISMKLLYLDEDNDGDITVVGENLEEGSSFFFALDNSRQVGLEGQLLELDDEGHRAAVHFDPEFFDSGLYRLQVLNPGGLQDNSQTMLVKFSKPMDVDVSLGYSCAWFPGDTLFSRYFGSSFLPLGGTFRLTFIPVKRKIGYFGAGLSVSAYPVKYENSAYTLQSLFSSAHLNFVYQWALIKKRLMLDTHAGFGVSALLGTRFVFDQVESMDKHVWTLSADLGAALQFYVLKRLYLEVNWDIVFPFYSQFPRAVFEPSVSVGWQF